MPGEIESFEQRIRAAAPGAPDIGNRHWVYVPYDQLTDATGPLTLTAPGDTGIVMMEALAKAHRRPYHKRKLVLILASQRHFALEQAARGVKVIYQFTPGIFSDGLVAASEEYKLPPLTMMEPAEREMRLDIEDAIGRGVRIDRVPNTTWLSTDEDFDRVYGYAAKKTSGEPIGKHHLMDRFYRRMREQTGYLMRDGEPEGGQFSYDAENRKPYRGQPPVPTRKGYAPDAITREAIAIVGREFPNHFGSAENWQLPLAAGEIEEAWSWTLRHLLPIFGPFEDAMYTPEPDMFHSRMSAFLNINRLLPRRVVNDVVEAAGKGLIPLASAEGFIRQILGWREFMRHIHRVTDGYRNITAAEEKRAPRKTGKAKKQAPVPLATREDEGARPSALDAARPLPAVYWGVPSGLNCLDTVVRQVVEEGWSHHITRLMVLANFATLAGYSPRELTDWFWIGYIDAYDWVVEPNVLGMGTFGDGGITATKPYVSGAAYVNRMSDYCSRCRYNPKIALGENACPFTALYWSFLEKHEPLLGRNPRMSMPYSTLRKKSPDERAALRQYAQRCVDDLAKATYDRLPG